MSEIFLTLKYIHDFSTITELRWSEGETRLVSAIDLVRHDIERILTEGLSEWIGEGDAVRQRTTHSSDPEFLPRLKAYFDRQFNFVIELTRRERARPKRDTRLWSAGRAHGPVRRLRTESAG